MTRQRLRSLVGFAGGLATVALVLSLGMPMSWPVVAATRAATHAHQDLPPKPGATPIVIGFPTATPGPKAPGRLTASDKQAAVQVALKSRYVKQLLGHRPFRVAGASPWSGSGTEQGALVELRLAHRATLTGQWLAMGGKPYTATYKNVLSLRVYVDVQRQRVVGIVPRAG